MVSGFLLLGSVSSTRFVARAGLDHEPHSLRQTSLSARAYLAEQREANTSMANAVVVHLEPGTHFIRSALELGPSDSGVRYVGVNGSATISGGIEVTGWQDAGPANCSGCTRVWKASLPPTATASRHLFVNGVRANRTFELFTGASTTKITADGYSMAVPASWHRNPAGSNIEMVYRGTHSAGAQWTESRCPVDGAPTTTAV